MEKNLNHEFLFRCMGTLNLSPLGLSDKIDLYDFTLPHLTIITRTLHHSTTLTHTLFLDIFSYLQIILISINNCIENMNLFFKLLPLNYIWSFSPTGLNCYCYHNHRLYIIL